MGTKMIETVLDGLLSAYMEARQNRTPRTGGSISFQDMDKVLSREDGAVKLMAESPIEGATRFAIRHCGVLLNREGGFDLMTEVCERVAKMKPGSYTRRHGVLNSAWDGIGDWAA